MNDATQRQTYALAYYKAVAEEAGRDAEKAIRERDRAERLSFYALCVAAGLAIALLYVGIASKPAPISTPRASGVMQLDPTTIRARQSEVIEI